MKGAFDLLGSGKPARLLKLKENEQYVFRNLQLLTATPVLYVCNGDEKSASSVNHYSEAVSELAESENARTVVICAGMEAELSQLDVVERTEYLLDIGIQETGLDRMINAGYELLNLMTYFTAGPKETRAWTAPKDSTAPRAAREIHTDFEHGVIRAEVISYEDYVSLGGEQRSIEAGRMRVEGKDYIVRDGAVIYFRFNV